MAVVLAIAAALAFAAGTVLQQRAAVREPPEAALRAGFMLRLARRPVWLAGIGADALGFVAQAAALGVGRLVVVQPMLALSVVFSLPLGAWLTAQRVGRRELAAALAVTGGLGMFLAVSDPSQGREDASVRAWAISGAAIAAATVPLVVAGARRAPAAKAAMLGSATGILFGLSAALTKATVERLDMGVLAVVGDWHLYALIAVGWASMALSQASLATGALAPAMATSMVLDPVTSLVLGVAAFGERLHDSPLYAAGSLLALAVVFAGLVSLAGAAQGGPGGAPSSARRAAA